jgi:hypothetical protein
MTHRTIHIRGWRVDVFISDERWPYLDEVVGCLKSIGADAGIIDKAVDAMGSGEPNRAFTFSNGGRTCIWIGWTTSGSEFINSMIHEIRHLVDHIAAYYGIENNEAVGYMSGDAAFALAEDICMHGCPCCGKED